MNSSDSLSRARTHTAAPVLEVFPSIQGEGLYVGELQVFLRLRGCPLRCRWCDTPSSWAVEPHASVRIETPAGPRREPSWATPFQAACWVAEAEPGEPRTVSVTGGEPLLWPGFLIALRGMLGLRRMHLETGGGHPESLARVVDSFDHVSLDLKLPADLGPPVELAHARHLEARPTSEPAPTSVEEWTIARRRALQLLTGRDACAKLVVAGERPPGGFEPLFEDVARLAPDLPVIVQPVTPTAGVPAPTLDEITAVAESARELDLAVRVLPQVHRALRVP